MVALVEVFRRNTPVCILQFGSNFGGSVEGIALLVIFSLFPLFLNLLRYCEYFVIFGKHFESSQNHTRRSFLQLSPIIIFIILSLLDLLPKLFIGFAVRDSDYFRLLIPPKTLTKPLRAHF